METFGRLDVLHNNAGIHESDLTTDMTVDSLPIEVWDTLMDDQPEGGLALCARRVPAPAGLGRRRDRQRRLDRIARRLPDVPGLHTAKHAIVGLTKCMAIDFRAAKIRANCYCPASVDTAMVSKFWEAAEDPEVVKSFMTSSHLHPKRLGYPEEVAKLVCFLASDEASFINGAAYLIDAGSLAWRGVE